MLTLITPDSDSIELLDYQAMRALRAWFRLPDNAIRKSLRHGVIPRILDAETLHAEVADAATTVPATIRAVRAATGVSRDTAMILIASAPDADHPDAELSPIRIDPMLNGARIGITTGDTSAAEVALSLLRLDEPRTGKLTSHTARRSAVLAALMRLPMSPEQAVLLMPAEVTEGLTCDEVVEALALSLADSTLTARRDARFANGGLTQRNWSPL